MRQEDTTCIAQMHGIDMVLTSRMPDSLQLTAYFSPLISLPQ